jgi:hypothetical protein
VPNFAEHYRNALDALAEDDDADELGADGPEWNASDDIEYVEEAVRSALENAQAFTGIMPGGEDNPAGDKIPALTDSTVASAWKTLVRQATTKDFPTLQQTKAQAIADPAGYGPKWIGTAKAIRSELQTIVDGAKDEGLAAALKSTDDAFAAFDAKVAALPGAAVKVVADAGKAAGAAVVDAAKDVSKAIDNKLAAVERIEKKAGIGIGVTLGFGALAYLAFNGRPRTKGGR